MLNQKPPALAPNNRALPHGLCNIFYVELLVRVGPGCLVVGGGVEEHAATGFVVVGGDLGNKDFFGILAD